MSLTSALKLGTKQAFSAISDLSLDLILIKRHVIDYDPVIGGPTVSESHYPFKGLFTDIKSDEVDDNLVASEIKKLYLEYEGFIPVIGDVIYTPDDIKFEINKVMPIKPGNTIFAFTLVVYR